MKNEIAQELKFVLFFELVETGDGSLSGALHENAVDV